MSHFRIAYTLLQSSMFSLNQCDYSYYKQNNNNKNSYKDIYS
ncbi:unnamed protein product [Paramecium primaurelia]|uniref:Uncharacterized protein n=1 Tax=Paramecium primaurelia TaxID=5886 RepID=A0A8S1PEZ5_PARPR|nr:unnamed protein product [Paramecium primaurelia]